MDDDRPKLRAITSGEPPKARTSRKGTRRVAGRNGNTIPSPGPGVHTLIMEPKVEERILQFVGLGASWTRAATAAGISKRLMYDWKKKADDGREPFATFMAKVEQAEAECELRLIALYQQAIPGDARGIERFLRTRFPERWNPDRMEVIDVDEIELEEPITTVEHLSEVVAALEEANIVPDTQEA